MSNIQKLIEMKDSIKLAISKVSTETLGWIAILVLHSATIPTLLAVMSGLTDRMPPVDLVLLVWSGLVMLFIKAAVQKDILNLVTIGLGFVVQSVLVALIFFK